MHNLASCLAHHLLALVFGGFVIARIVRVDLALQPGQRTSKSQHIGLLTLKATVSSRGIRWLLLFTTVGLGGGEAGDSPPMTFCLICLPRALNACRLSIDPMDALRRRVDSVRKMLPEEPFCSSSSTDMAIFLVILTSSGSNCSLLRSLQERGVGGALGD